MDDTNPIDKETWWGCRRCPRWIRKDTWHQHGSAHSMVEAALRLKLSTDRAMKIDHSAFRCGIDGRSYATSDLLMTHLEDAHFTVYSREGKRKGGINV
jgi:hypothetical protein